MDENAFGERMNLELSKLDRKASNSFQQDKSIKRLIPKTIQALAKETLLWLQGKRPKEHWLTTGMQISECGGMEYIDGQMQFNVTCYEQDETNYVHLGNNQI